MTPLGWANAKVLLPGIPQARRHSFHKIARVHYHNSNEKYRSSSTTASSKKNCSDLCTISVWDPPYYRRQTVLSIFSFCCYRASAYKANEPAWEMWGRSRSSNKNWVGFVLRLWWWLGSIFFRNFPVLTVSVLTSVWRSRPTCEWNKTSKHVAR